MIERTNCRKDSVLAMAISAHTVANELRQRLGDVGNVKLHKLLYYCQGWHLAWTGQPLFREVIEAWSMGPVVAVVWRDEARGEVPSVFADDLTADMYLVIDYVVSRYGGYTGQQLVVMTHSERPWLVTWQSDDGQSDPIDLDQISDYFSGLDGEIRGDEVLSDEARAEARRAAVAMTHGPRDDIRDESEDLRRLARELVNAF